MLWYSPFPKVNAGPDNHYDRLVAIAKHMNAYSNAGVLPPAIDAELEEAVLLLREHNPVPQQVIEARWNSETGLNGRDMMALIGRFREAAENATIRGKFGRTAEYALAIIRFDAMAGQGEQSHFAYGGYELLSEYRRDFSNATARDVIRLLRQTIAERYDVEFLIACRQAQSERQAGWHQKLRSILARLGGKPAYDLSTDEIQIRETREGWDTKSVLLQTDLAIGVFQSDHGRLPVTLAELVPDYLPAVPIDPHWGAALVYRPVGSTFTLYCVGPNGKNDGGPRVTLSSPTAPSATSDDIGLSPPRPGKN